MCAGKSRARKATPLWSAQPSESRLSQIQYHRASLIHLTSWSFSLDQGTFQQPRKIKRGFSVFPVDHEFNTHKTAVSTVCLNLQDTKSQALVESIVSQTKPAAVHLGLPCGKCSRARDKPLPPHLREEQHTGFHRKPRTQLVVGSPHLNGKRARGSRIFEVV